MVSSQWIEALCKAASIRLLTTHSSSLRWSMEYHHKAYSCIALPLVQYRILIALNSLTPGRFQRNIRKAIFQPILVIDGWSISCKIVLKWMPMDLTYGKSTLVQVMAWCCQAPSHYLSQCWPRSLSPYGVIRPQWVLSWPSQVRSTAQVGIRMHKYIKWVFCCHLTF